ncbi:glutathione S-transferase [Vibrio sp. Of14-4]|uniref:glutathione S-transferase family protein n=1 Tax=Vibrio sp. Of14-4 TaxID=2724878 RepID=UPI001EF392AD|nr:glutathione S-transferase family protein [Vibrio sp. Of14-4]MCG7490554.1 glutathione S-transferase [Vibrio sp. Of14-4]
MELLYSPNSPYARVARVVMRYYQLQNQITEIALHPYDNSPKLLEANPLVKVPALLLGPGQSMMDSEVIALYLDRELGAGKLTARLEKDWQYRADVSLCKGLVDSCIMLRGEKYRRDEPEEVASEFFSQRFRQAITRGLNYFDQGINSRGDESFSILNVWLVIIVDYVNLRHPEFDIDNNYRDLYQSYNNFCHLDFFKETLPTG